MYTTLSFLGEEQIKNVMDGESRLKSTLKKFLSKLEGGRETRNLRLVCTETSFASNKELNMVQETI